MKKLMFKSMVILSVLCLGSTQAHAQGFLKKLAKSAEKLTATSADTTATDTAEVKPLNWDKIPVYHAEKRTVTNADGTVMKNEDGTPMVRVLLVDQNGQTRSPEAVKEQHKKLNKAITNILLKVGGGAAVGVAGGLLASKGKASGGIIGGVAGATAGLALSSKDIKAAKQQKESLKAQEELIAEYQKNFTDEGTPIDASVDVEKIEGLDISEGVSMTAEALKAELSSDSFNSSPEDWTL